MSGRAVRSASSLALLLSFALAEPAPASMIEAQADGVVSGVVHDESGLPPPGATVTVNPAGVPAAVVQTARDGSFSVRTPLAPLRLEVSH